MRPPVLRPLNDDDAHWLGALFADVELRAALYAEELRPPPLEQVLAQWLRPHDAAWRAWAICVDGEAAGVLGLAEGELAFALAPAARGRGLIRAALGRLDGPLRAITARGNLAARRSLAKSGFRFAGLCGSGAGPALLDYRRDRFTLKESGDDEEAVRQ